MYLGQPASLFLFIVHSFNHLFLHTYVYTYIHTKGLGSRFLSALSRLGVRLLQFKL